MFWNYRGYPWDKGLELSDVEHGVDVIFLVETWEHDSIRIPKVDGHLIKSTWTHSKGNLGLVG